MKEIHSAVICELAEMIQKLWGQKWCSRFCDSRKGKNTAPLKFTWVELSNKHCNINITIHFFLEFAEIWHSIT